MSADNIASERLAAWRNKNHLSEDDPIHALPELLAIYLESAPPRIPEQLPSYGEFRDTVEKLQQQTRTLVSQSADLVMALRAHSQAHTKRSSFQLLLTAGIIFAIGFAAGLVSAM